MDNGNGKLATSATLTLTLDLLTFHLDVKAEGPNTDCFLAMLEQAKRALEMQSRAQMAAALQQQAREQAESQRLAQLIRKGN